jgi:NTE family protein
MGLEPIWKRYGVLLVSNAGNLIEEEKLPWDWFSLLERIVGMIHRQAENNRQRVLMFLAKSGNRKVAYWPLRNTLAKYPTQPPVSPTPGDVTQAQQEAVRLWSLSPEAFRRLANHGYTLCDAAVRSYLNPAAPAPTALPF